MPAGNENPISGRESRLRTLPFLRRAWVVIGVVILASGLSGILEVPALAAAGDADHDLAERFGAGVRPFLQKYCFECHDDATRKGDLDLTRFNSADAVAQDYGHWDLVSERLRNGDMPPRKASDQPSDEERSRVIAWSGTFRKQEALRNAGDPGLIPARRLSNAEYDATLRDLTGVDIRPTRTFPVDPANQAGFDNSAESLAMSPALVTKYLQAARDVADHLVLQPDGFRFAPHPVIADTDRDKWAVFRIVDFYRRQPTDLADYFVAAWRFQHRAASGRADATLTQIAVESHVSAKYLARVGSMLSGEPESVGPIANLQQEWGSLPAPGTADAEVEVRRRCEQMRDDVVRIRNGIVPEVKNLRAPPIHDGSQTLVMWKNRQMAANRRRYDPAVLKSADNGTDGPAPVGPDAPVRITPSAKDATLGADTNRVRTNRPPRHVQAPTPEIVKKGGVALAPVLVTTGSSATARMAAVRQRGDDPDLMVPANPAERARYEAAFARFADLFPDAFYITERARVYLDAVKEQENEGRLLSAGLHSMTGYFRDDQPLYDMILDEAGQRELDALWDDFDMASSVPQRMHESFVWFERTDSAYLRDPEFDVYRPEDKSVTSPEKVRALAALYLDKARRNNASETAQAAIQDHFDWVAAGVARVERMRSAAEPIHRDALETFAGRAYRRPLTPTEREELRTFYQASRTENGASHEDAIRDGIVRVLLSPHFSFRMDLVEAAGPSDDSGGSGRQAVAVEPLSDHALASRLSYFLWSSMPDEALSARAAAGDLHRPEVLVAETRRMLQDARVRNFAAGFAGSWLDFRRFEEINSVDRGRFPEFTGELRSAMYEEPLRFFMDVVQRDRPVLDLLFAKDTFVNGPLARHYGMVPPVPDTEWVHVADARSVGRGGLLPMAAFLTANSPGLRTSPVKRGYWVVRRVLGERIPPPPANVPALPKDERDLGDRTLRDALTAHRERTGCAECHARFDSFGLVFESYGPVGERRETDLGGRPVDTRAEFPGGFEGAGLDGLLEYVRDHRKDEFLDTLCRKLLAYGLGRTLILGDEPLVDQMRDGLAKNGHRFGGGIESIVTSPQFLNKRAYPPREKP